jgi:uncharacterized membrane protein
MENYSIALILMALFYMYAGVNHFYKPKFYLRAMPTYIPNHQFMVQFSGIAELILGIGLLIPATRVWSAWGIILLLIAVFPSNIYMLTSGKFSKIPKWFLYIRLPLQFVLIWWAYQYTK